MPLFDPKRLLEALGAALNPFPINRLGDVVSILGASLLAAVPNSPPLLAEKMPTLPKRPTPFPFWNRLEKRGFGLSLLCSALAVAGLGWLGSLGRGSLS